jgi:hypothetical protein
LAKSYGVVDQAEDSELEHKGRGYLSGAILCASVIFREVSDVIGKLKGDGK